MKKKIYDLGQIEAISAGNNEFVAKMVNMFLDTTPDHLAQIEEFIQTEQWKEVGLIAHKIKPSIDLMGIEALHDVIRSIEQSGKNEENLDELPGLYATLSQTLNKVFEELKNR